MAKISTIKEVLAQENDTIVTAVQGKLTGLFKIKKGTNANGDWSFQRGELTDATGKIQVVFKDRDEVPMTLKGKLVTLLAYHGDKGWSGIKSKDDTYNDVTKRVLWMTKTGELVVAGSGSSTPAPAERPPSEAAEAPAAAEPNAEAPAPVAKDSVEHIIDAKVFLARRGNALLMAANETLRVIENFAKANGLGFDDDTKHAVAQTIGDKLTETTFTSLFIAMDRAGLVDDFPSSSNINEKIAEAKNRVEQRVKDKAEKSAKARK